MSFCSPLWLMPLWRWSSRSSSSLANTDAALSARTAAAAALSAKPLRMLRDFDIASSCVGECFWFGEENESRGTPARHVGFLPALLLAPRYPRHYLTRS